MIKFFSEKRTRVIDDESDYFSSSSVWLSETERNRLKEKEEELRQAKYSRNNKITFDFAGNYILIFISIYKTRSS